MTDWTFGENVVKDIDRMHLRMCGFPDADVCPMPLEHKERVDTHRYEKDERTKIQASQTEWISGIPWGEL